MAKCKSLNENDEKCGQNAVTCEKFCWPHLTKWGRFRVRLRKSILILAGIGIAATSGSTCFNLVVDRVTNKKSEEAAERRHIEDMDGQSELKDGQSEIKDEVN